MITSHPDIQAGEPCIEGTRLPAICIWVFHRDGYKPKQIRRQYPFVTLRQIGAAIRYHTSRRSREQFDRDRYDP